MPVYRPISDVMPAAAMVTGAVVPAALGDQIRDNLVALWQGWWFRATRSTNQVIGAAATTPIVLDTLAQSQTSVDDGSIVLTAGNVVTTKPGLWLVGGHLDLATSTSTTLVVAVDSTDSAGAFLADQVSDTANSKSAAAMSITTKVTTALNTFTLVVYSTGGTTVEGNAMTAMYGVFLGDNP